MSGDSGIAIVIPAALEAIQRDENLKLILVGDTAVIEQALPEKHPRIEIVHSSQIVGMDESPFAALRFKKDSSMRVAINLVKEGRADACVSAGNTGALMATARFVLKTISGIDRPAIISSLPTTAKKETRLLDLGANVDSSADHLLQFAIMGSALVSCVDNIPFPKVALLNIGSEEIKGNETVKLASQKLTDFKGINFVGYVEGDDVFKGLADIVVCDGFVGNVALKSIEGVALLLTHYLKQSFQSTLYGKFVALVASPIIRKLAKKLDPSRYNGASLLGLNGIVVKSHGGTDIIGFRHAIEEARKEVEHNVPNKITEQVARMLEGVEKV